MATNEQSPLRAVLNNIEVEGVNKDGKKQRRSWYFVQLSMVSGNARATLIAKSTKKPVSPMLRWEWNANNQIEISYEQSSTIQIALYRGFKQNTILDDFVGQYEGKLADLFNNGEYYVRYLDVFMLNNTDDEPTDTSFGLTDKKGIPVSTNMKIALTPVSALATTPSQADAYVAIGGRPAVVTNPDTGVQQAKAVGEALYEGLKEVVDALYDCSDIFLPLKTAAGVFRTITKFVETMSENKQDLDDLKVKLGAILSIVEKYKNSGGLDAVTRRIEDFTKAVSVQLNTVQMLQDSEQSTWTRVAFTRKDANAIVKVLRNINSLCDVLQLDTQLNIDITVGKVLEYMNSGKIDKLNHEMTSYKTRMSSYGDPTGCMEGTRVNVLEGLDAWASETNGSKVYWMVGMAGIGKSTIAHTFCEILEAKNLLCGSFFASRASEKTSNARLIIPVIAHALARSSPHVKVNIVKAIEADSTLAEPTYSNMCEQFKQLICDSTQATTGLMNIPCKVVVIDAVDECTNLDVVAFFINLVLQSVSKIPFKVFISSREEFKISNTFKDSSGNYKSTNLFLHEIEKDVVQEDIHIYLETSLAKIHRDNHGTPGMWPSQSELKNLVKCCGELFIYAATSVRYIESGGKRYKSRLSAMANHGLELVGTEFKTDIDTLYIHILEMACKGMLLQEVKSLRDILSIVIFLYNPLPIQAIESLSEMDASSELSLLTSVIHFPTAKNAVVSPFHASFPDFITSPSRCSPSRISSEISFPVLDAAEGHQQLALKCLQLLNNSLKYNVCDIPKEFTVSHRERTNALADPGKISAAVKYACIYWAAHLAQVKIFDPNLAENLSIFLYSHLLHWIECLSILGELQTGVKSLGSVATVLWSFGYHDLQVFAVDACQCVKMSFEAVQRHCMEIYQSALVWIPMESLIRKTYNADVCKVPKVGMGLPNLWGAVELVMQNGSSVNSVAFSQDGSHIVSGSGDNTVRIWNVTTGETEAVLKGHTSHVESVAFSQDGSHIVSGSWDNTVRIWNVTTGETEAVLKGHTNSVTSVAFSQDGSHIVSGSYDNTVRIWNVTTGETEAVLKGHTRYVTSVAFSQDGSHIVSGSWDNTVRIWNVTTGETEAVLKGHTNSVTSVAFSQDGSHIVSGSDDNTVRIWNVTTGETEAVLKGHTNSVTSVAFSQDGSHIVSGSDDNTVRIWNVTTGETEAVLKGHTNSVTSVAFSQDGSHIVSGSDDNTVWIWNVTTGETEAVLKGHTRYVTSVAFSQDGSHIVSGSDDNTVQIWNVTTGETEAVLKGHTNSVTSVAFSQDGSHIVSGSDDNTVWIWNVTTGETEAVLKGHTRYVTSVAFSQDGSHIVSGSWDNTVRIWNVTTGETEAVLKGHTNSVTSVAFSQDGSHIVSGSDDNTVRIWNVTTVGHSMLSIPHNNPQDG
ncbi:hypothetical protein D9619_011432 [Psilocybe cf. subviscida]|uniref:NACHT domain-containing protein n=1 Tax=Psilocybe cf. subviscida TaxID=2480587 RepID=A0A8H5BJ94_9AGAR|nr:hypothetical protein D9619_011432 [Psilocybe cf. subviscida]